MAAEQKTRLQQGFATLLSCVIIVAMLCSSCYIAVLQAKVCRSINKLELRVDTIERKIFQKSIRKTSNNDQETDHFYQTFLLKTVANEVMKVDSGHLKEIKLRLNAYEAVNRRNRLVTWKLKRRVDSLKTNLHLSDNTYKVFGNEQVLVRARDKRSVRLGEKARDIPWKLYMPVSLTITGNKTMGTVLTLRGPPGEKGKPGARGKRGKAGPRGLKGDNGDIGLKGDAGMIGRTGEKGQKGNKGHQGSKGERGGTVAVPKIIAAPVNQTVLSPGQATFTCEATGSPKPQVTLVPKGKVKDSRYETFDEGTLSIRNVMLTDKGAIECIAKNALGEERRTAYLFVNAKAKATIRNKAIRTEAGLNVVIDCVVEGFPEPVVTWKRAGKNLPSSTRFSNNNKRIELVRVSSGDGGNYICEAVNAHATSSAFSFVAVVDKLTFLAKPNKRMLVNTFLNFNIPCAYIGGVPPVEVTWKKDGKELQDKAVISKDLRTLEIKNVTKDDLGTYSCHVKSQMSYITMSVELLSSNFYLPTCGDLKKNGIEKSGHFLINPSRDPSERPVNVYCEMEGRNGVTLVSHDSEANTEVNGLEPAGSYSKKVIYAASDIQIKALTRISKRCKQYIKYECTGSVLYLHRKSPIAWWVSFTGQRMLNWGGVSYPNKGCACTLNKSCPSGGTCMCDINGGTWSDGGFLRDKEFLPVKELRFGDTADSSEIGYHVLGKLQCF